MRAMSTLSFRTAPAHDLTFAQRLANFVNSAYRGPSSQQGWTTEADLLDGTRTEASAILESLAQPDVKIEIAFVPPDDWRACMQLKRESAETCYLGMLTVDPTAQAKGVGRQMLARAAEVALAWGCRQIRITVIPQRAELIAYYERRGFFKTGKEEPFPEGDPRFGIPKVTGLRLIEMIWPIASAARSI